MPDPSGHCVSAADEGLPPEWGAMGIHYLHPGLLGITATEPRVDGVGLHTDFLNPSILLYEPQADGSLVLVGVENLVFEAAWRRAGNGDAPSLAGRLWDYMADDPATPGDEAHGFEPQWDQHVWFRPNPFGALNPFNPNVTCEHHATAQAHHHDRCAGLTAPDRQPRRPERGAAWRAERAAPPVARSWTRAPSPHSAAGPRGGCARPTNWRQMRQVPSASGRRRLA